MNGGPSASPRKLDVATAVVCALAAVAVFLLFRELRHDDDFITFRYARNLVEGNGLVFNPGQRILGTTSPLFALGSAALCAVVGADRLPEAAVALNALSLAAQAFLLYLLVRRRLPATALALAALTLAGATSPYTYLGLETHTYAALLLAAVWSTERGRPGLCGAFAGLAFLARHDAALLVPLVLLRYRHGDDQRDGLRFLAAAAAPVFPWLLFATAYYGWPLPRTLQAKAGLTPAWDYAAAYLERFFLVPGFSASPAVHALAAVLAMLGLAIVARRLRSLLVLPAFGLTLFLVYAVIGPPSTQSWHMYPAMLAVRMLMVVGALGGLESSLGAEASAAWRSWRRVLVATVAVLWLVPLTRYALETSRKIGTDFWFGGRHARYEHAAEWMLEHAGPGRSLLAIEVGTLGYLTDYEMIDAFGLVTATAGDAEDAEHVVSLMYKHRPDLVLLHAPIQGRRFEEITPYRTIHVFPWLNPWSTLLAREPSVLRRPEELPDLRRQLEAFQARDGTSLGWPDVSDWRGEDGRSNR